MYKTILLVILTGTFFFTACKNNNKLGKTTASTIDEPTIIEEDVIEEIPNESDIDFESALAAFEEDDNSLAADYIELAIYDLREESEGLTKDDRVKVEMSIAALVKLEKELRAGNVEDERTLEDAFFEAEMTVAHNYLVISDIYFLTNPAKSKLALEHAVDKIENATEVTEGFTNKEVMIMLAENKTLLNSFDDNSTNFAVKISNQLDKMKTWLKNNIVELESDGLD